MSRIQPVGARLLRTGLLAAPRCRPLPAAATASCVSPVTTDTKLHQTTGPSGRAVPGLHAKAQVGGKRFADFDLAGKAFVVTGGARGLGLALAEGLVEAGGKVYCLDRLDQPDEQWNEAKERVARDWGGSLVYRRLDVRNTKQMEQVIGEIADENQGIHGLVAAAGVQQVTPAVHYTAEDANKMLSINYTAVMMTATVTARNMLRYRCRGSICMVASMSGSVANKGLLSPVYNSSKAALIQLARCLAMEWSPMREDGSGGIRVNTLSPGHIVTPMVRKNFEEVPGLKEKWSRENMMGRLANTAEFKGAALFLLSNASSFMTGNDLVIDGGHTAW